MSEDQNDSATTVSGPLMDLLKLMVLKNGSDLYLTVGSPPGIKMDGKLVYIGNTSLSSVNLLMFAKTILSLNDYHEFSVTHEVNIAMSVSGVGRFRVNGYYQRNQIAFVLRHIKTDIPSMESINLPPILKEIAMSKRGLVLFVGATGSGKSTSLAALVGYRNEHDAGHIITIEDPIEFIHKIKKVIISQREVGIDTATYEEGLRNTLRQAPDVILIGEIRSQATMEHAITFAETGHLCLATLHANNANQAIDRIINFFGPDRKNQILMDLSLNIRAVVSQRLIPMKSGSRIAAMEILLGSSTVQDKIRKGAVDEVKDIMVKSRNMGMQTFDQALTDLVIQGFVSIEEALLNSDSPTDTRLAIREGCARAGLPDYTLNASTTEGGQGSGEWSVL